MGPDPSLPIAYYPLVGGGGGGGAGGGWSLTTSGLLVRTIRETYSGSRIVVRKTDSDRNQRKN